jgi:hypothetical protein
MQSSPGVDLADILMKGGEQRVALLRYCVMSVTMEPVFVFLAQEYRLRPTHAAALALYDVFCARNAAARITVWEALPPRNLQLQAAVDSIREQWAQLQLASQPDEHSRLAITLPHRNLFDRIADAARSDPTSGFARICSRYDPRLAPEQSLSGGRMSAVQRHFVENIWRPVARPRLVAAGFWQIANIE